MKSGSRQTGRGASGTGVQSYGSVPASIVDDAIKLQRDMNDMNRQITALTFVTRELRDQYTRSQRIEANRRINSLQQDLAATNTQFRELYNTITSDPAATEAFMQQFEELDTGERRPVILPRDL